MSAFEIINAETERVKNEVPEPFFVPHNTIKFSLPGAGSFRIGWNYTWSHEDIRTEFIARVRLDGLFLINPEEGGAHREKPRSATGIFPGGGSTLVSLASGIHILILETSTSVKFIESSIYTSLLEVRRYK